jgi:hypothetical protein
MVERIKMSVKWNTLSIIMILNGLETDIDILVSNCITTMEENSVLISLNMKKMKNSKCPCYKQV